MPRQQLIKIRTGSTAPNAADFATSEPAWDGTNKKLYVKAADGTMAQIGGGSSGGSSSPGANLFLNITSI